MFTALAVATLIAAASMVGVLFFTHDRHLVGLERFAIPVAVGVFLSLVLNELIPETVAASSMWGGVVIAAGFISFYVLANLLHKRFHHLAAEECDKKGAAALLLVGDGVHNFADGVVLGSAFLIDPAVGMAVAVGLLVHEVPQEIVEFGVLIRAGYTRFEALTRNFLSALSIVFGTAVTMLVFAELKEYLWILTGFAAGNLLFLAASDLLPRIHGNLKNYGSMRNATLAIIGGFVAMSFLLHYAHEMLEEHEGEHVEELHLH